MNVLSLFDGISCGQVALNKVGIKYDNYFASEIDKYAIKVTQHNYPSTIQLGDVSKINGADLPKIDLLVGGSPCQGFSFAGRQLNFNDPRSALFFEFVRLIKECKPKYFLLENVKMKKEYQDIISSYLEVEPIKINSSLVSAQSRERLYWTNIPNVTQPEDKNILLKEILLNNTYTELDKAYCLTSSYNGAVLWNSIQKAQRTMVWNKQITVNTIDKGQKEYLIDGKNVKLSTKNTSSEARENFNQVKNYARKLSPIECERLQTLPDDYTSVISNTQRYKCLGNGWTVDVIAHIFKNIKH
jgi:DNA (cytosine-5)-methyltransferase 3A